MTEVISENQRQLNAALHHQDNNYGNRDNAAGLASLLPTAIIRMHELGVCNSVLDYGTGKGALVEKLIENVPKTINIKGYDPAVSHFSEKPNQTFDILTCLDVLEHVEMGSIDAVLHDIKNLTKNFCYLVIDLQPAVKKLADGRNAHILLAPPEWWVTRISQLFPCMGSFPVMHTSGEPQKLVIAACQQTKLVPIMYSFLIKLKIFDCDLSGGVLEKMARLKGGNTK